MFEPKKEFIAKLEKEFHCPECGQKFNVLGLLITHEDDKSLRAIYRCSCGRTESTFDYSPVPDEIEIDLKDWEEKRFSRYPEISADEVLEVRSLVKSWSEAKIRRLIPKKALGFRA